jgi:hypothetical protein
MIYPFQIGLVESTGRADPGLLFQINSFRLNSGNNKKHGLCIGVHRFRVHRFRVQPATSPSAVSPSMNSGPNCSAESGYLSFLDLVS